jgi:hypothetical protein
LANIRNDISYLTENALDWISNILSVRFGFKVNLFKYNEFSLKMIIKGFNSFIIIDNLVSDFANPHASLYYTTWNPTLHGYSSLFNEDIPMPGYSIASPNLIEENNGLLFFHFDIIGLIYWSLVRVEEYNDKNLDLHQRFNINASHAKCFNYLDRPIVDEWIEILKQIVKKKEPDFEFKINDFKIILSHDVDRPFFYLFLSKYNLFKLIFGDIFKRLSFFSAIQRVIFWINVKLLKKLKKDPYYTFDFIMDEAEKRGIKSVFYFMTDVSNLLYDSDYAIEDDFILKLIKNINERNHYIGLHPSYETYLDSILIKREKKLLENAIKKIGFNLNFIESRMHYLRFDIKTTPIILHKNNINRDSSLNFSLESGFRCGTCFDYFMFDHNRQTQLTLIQRPLLVMDNNFLPINDTIDFSQKIEKVFKIKKYCKAVGGNFTILWHNSELYNSSLRKLFIDVIN